jgi:hypothetical protein
MADEGPYRRFCGELEDLIDRWRAKPADDCLSVGEFIGALTIQAHAIAREALDEPDNAED